MRTPRRAGEVRVSAAALASSVVAPVSDADGAARLLARRAAAPIPPDTQRSSIEVARILARRAHTADPAAPTEPVPDDAAGDVTRILRRRFVAPPPVNTAKES